MKFQLNEFLEKNLPDYQEKRSAYFQDFDIASEDFMSDFEETFFSEALQNFADKLCEKQRENCAEG
jgi:hypothetical protein